MEGGAYVCSVTFFRRGLALTAVLLALVGPACGGGGDEGEGVRAAIAETQAAFDAGDLPAVCQSLTAAARKHIMSLGHRSLGSCAADLRLIHKSIGKNDRGPAAAGQEIVDVEIDGDSATVTMAFSGDSRGVVPLAREDGGWKVDGLYGGMPAGLQEDKY
jgi:hypothetical protein